MARQIKETPILFGNDAKRFEQRMQEKRTETSAARELRLRNYEEFMAMLARGKNIKMTTR